MVCHKVHELPRCKWGHGHVRTERARARPYPVRVHRLVPHHLSGDHDRARQLSRSARRPVALEAGHRLSRPHFCSKIFAVNFAMGVVSGLVMAYQFGSNWSYFSAFAGSITGPLLAYEVLTAFFLEARFLGVMLFGWNKVGPGLHFFATVMVAIGTLVSATRILASNSWMQTPQGFEISTGAWCRSIG
jgi:hypothetical protein